MDGYDDDDAVYGSKGAVYAPDQSVEVGGASFVGAHDEDCSPSALPPEILHINSVVQEGLKRIYAEKVRPMEQMYGFDKFHDLLSAAEFEAKPSVLLIGQYSVGKTTFIRQLLGMDFPGLRIGPEPTTDRFVAVSHGPDPRVIPGNACVVQPGTPYRSLSRFGVEFLNKFEGSQCPAKFLESITLIDTPGVLAGEKHTAGRGYNFEKVISWFSYRCDLILLLFDANKTDIGDEMRSMMAALKGNEEKVRVVLNKADVCDKQQLMRVYGSLMWSLGKVLNTPEVTRVYIGSFREDAYDSRGLENADLFDSERADLMADMRMLPRNSVIRKINTLVKRARLVKVHAYIMSTLRDKMPSMFGAAAAKSELLATLPALFQEICRTNNLTWGDFPPPQIYREKLGEEDFYKFAPMHAKLLQAMEAVLHTDIPRLMAMLPDEAAYAYSNPSGLDPGSAEAMQALPQLGVGDGWVVCNHEKAESGRWQEDTAQPYCPLCANDFGLTLRRHHCRKCGGVFCNDCTTFSQQGKSDTRICNGCKSAYHLN